MVKKRNAQSKPVRNSASGGQRRKGEVSTCGSPRYSLRRANGAKVLALIAARVADERHCSDIVVLDLRGKSPATDYFVIATGTSDRQRRTVADEICEAAREVGLQRFGRAGYEQGRWILLDFIDVVIHIFDRKFRDYYDLELLWGDAKRLKLQK